MLGSNIVLLAVTAAVAVSAGGGHIDIAQEVRRGFRSGLVYPRQQQNLQSFTGALGGVKASAITNSGDSQRPFEVDGDTFTDFQSAANRACDNQHNSCAEMSNNGTADFPVSDCDQQTTECKSAASANSDAASSTQTAAATLVSSNADFDFFCES